MNYITKLAIISIILFTTLYSFVLSIDPYDKFGFNPWQLNTKAIYSDRDEKFYHINQPKNQYNFFVLGSSRAQYINPEQIDRITQQKSYNYSVTSGQPEDYLAITKQIFDTQKPKTILLYLDFKNLNVFNKVTKQFSDAKLLKYFDKSVSAEEKSKPFLLHKTYMTLTSLIDSIRIIFKNIFLGNTPSVIKANGMFAKEPGALYKKAKLEMPYFTEYYHNYKIDKKRILYLREIKKLCDEKHVKLIVCISPVSKEHLDKILQNNNLRKIFFEFKRILTSIFGELNDFNNYAISKYDGYYWVDSVHVTKELAYFIIERTLAETKENSLFGYKLMNNNIEQYIKNFDILEQKE